MNVFFLLFFFLVKGRFIFLENKTKKYLTSKRGIDYENHLLIINDNSENISWIENEIQKEKISNFKSISLVNKGSFFLKKIETENILSKNFLLNCNKKDEIEWIDEYYPGFILFNEKRSIMLLNHAFFLVKKFKMFKNQLLRQLTIKCTSKEQTDWINDPEQPMIEIGYIFSLHLYWYGSILLKKIVFKEDFYLEQLYVLCTHLNQIEWEKDIVPGLIRPIVFKKDPILEQKAKLLSHLFIKKPISSLNSKVKFTPLNKDDDFNIFLK